MLNAASVRPRRIIVAPPRCICLPEAPPPSHGNIHMAGDSGKELTWQKKDQPFDVF